MIKTAITLFFSSLVAVAAVSTAAPAKEYRIALTSYGPARIGMNRDALEAALGSKLKIEEEERNGCEYVAPTKGFDGVLFMLLDQRLARIETSSLTVMTLSGAHIGATPEAIMALYPGRIEVSPHAYPTSDPDATYLTMYSSDEQYGIRFEIYDGKVTALYAGTAEAIGLVERCS